MAIRVLQAPLDPWVEVTAYQNTQGHLSGKFGATAVFVGCMRDFNQGAKVGAMTLEHYPGMTEKHLEAVEKEAAARWDILASLVVHRVGPLRPNDPIVLVAVWSVHRDAAFQACRFIIDELKTRAPFWKQEDMGGAARWVTPE
jgi:molybdopterin synthase catalytic subunit